MKTSYKLVLLGILLCILNSCTSTRIVEVPQISYVATSTVDTILLYDSIISKERIYEKDGVMYNITQDIVYRDRYQVKYKDSIRVDTITKVVTVPKEVTKEVNKLNWIQQFLIYIGILSILVAIITLIVKYSKAS